MPPSIAIVDYGVGNLRSVQKMLARTGAEAIIAADAHAFGRASGIVLPGVGAFGQAMAKLRESGLIPTVRRLALEERKPLLGICLGLQLLAKDSDEGGRHQGLGLIPAVVRRLDVTGLTDWIGRRLVLPHIGWNAVKSCAGSRLFTGIPDETDFYFAHSYQVFCTAPEMVAATCTYGTTFTCAVESNNVFGVQFHPEKSQSGGIRLIRNFVEHCRMQAVA